MRLRKSNPAYHPMFNSVEPVFLNPQARPGFGKALSKAYAEWSENNPGHSREQGMEAHAKLADELRQHYPTYGELYGSPS